MKFVSEEERRQKSWSGVWSVCIKISIKIGVLYSPFCPDEVGCWIGANRWENVCEWMCVCPTDFVSSKGSIPWNSGPSYTPSLNFRPKKRLSKDAALSIDNKGIEHFKAKNYQMAIKMYCKAILYMEKPSTLREKDIRQDFCARILSHRSASKLKLRDNTGALLDAESAYANALSSINNGMALYHKGKALMALDDPESAVQNFQGARSWLSKLPNKKCYMARALYYEGTAYMALDEPQYALKNFQEARDLLYYSRYIAKTLYYEGKAFKAIGELDSAVQSFKQARKLLPENSAYIGFAYFYEGEAFNALGRLDSAAESYRNAREFLPDDEKALAAAALMKIADGGFP